MESLSSYAYTELVHCEARSHWVVGVGSTTEELDQGPGGGPMAEDATKRTNVCREFTSEPVQMQHEEEKPRHLPGHSH
jgi:hypothetical protein